MEIVFIVSLLPHILLYSKKLASPILLDKNVKCNLRLMRVDMNMVGKAFHLLDVII